MPIISLHVLKWAEEDSKFLCSAYELGFVSWFKRPFFKETVNFGARTTSNRTKMGESVALHLPDAQAMCYITVTKTGLSFAVLADDKYPQRIAFIILQKMAVEFSKAYDPTKFIGIQKDTQLQWPIIEQFIKKFQDPKEVDKLEKIKDQLKQVEQIVHKNLNDLLKRGEDLDKLMIKSKDVSNLSMDFYRTAKKANTRCCSLY